LANNSTLNILIGEADYIKIEKKYVCMCMANRIIIGGVY